MAQAEPTDVTLRTGDGESIQAELWLPESPRAAVVITHPHPQMGGDMYTPVPSAFFQAVAGSDVAALRFNFRGVGSSTGVHDHGGAERLDLQAAIDHVRSLAPAVPLFLAGWSFGADVALTVDDDSIAGWVLAAPPLSVVSVGDMAAGSLAAPKVLAIGEHDQFNPPGKARKTVADWQNTSIEEIEGADHFFAGHTSALAEVLLALVNS